jgi:hypothetical protein
MPLKKTKQFVTFLSIVVLGVAGCCTSLYEQNRASRQDKAASVHMAVLSVAQWEDYRDALQPAFKMTPDDAVSQAIPSTLALEEKFLNAFAAKFKVALPGATSTDTATKILSKGQVVTNSQQITKTTSSGDASALTFADSPAGSQTAAGLPPSTSVLGTPLSVDPMLRYLAATALYQEVQLLNRYVKSAAIDERYSAYVVRMQITLMPRMRDEPYDAYSTLSFFPGPFKPDTGGGSPVRIESVGPNSEPNQVKIVPLLVTDDIEAAMHSRSLDEITQLGLALSAVIQGVGVGADVQNMNEKLRSVLGRDFNSTFTVARVSDNTLRCRFGAQNEANSRYAMIPQTHNVTLLVLLPKESATTNTVPERTIRMSAKTTLIDVATGEDLPGRSSADAYKELRKVLKQHGITAEPRDNEISQLFYSVADSDYDGFMRRMQSIVNPVPYPESLWVDLVSIRNGGQYSSASFVVPRKEMPIIKKSPGGFQIPVLIDDGKTASTVKITSGAGLESDKLTATLTVTNAVASTVTNVVGGVTNTVTTYVTNILTFNHTDLKVINGGQEVIVTFPSLAAYKINKDGKPGTSDSTFSLFKPGAATALFSKQCFYIMATEPAKALFTMSTHASVIAADKDSSGKLQLIFSGKPSDKSGISFTVKGAEAQIDATPGGPTVTLKDDGWTVDTYGPVNLKLSNLDPISPVTISAKDTTNNVALTPIVLPVVRHVEYKP